MPREHSDHHRSRGAVARPEFHQLQVFLTVVQARSFAAAARQMGRTQPAISQAIARLEDIYGGDLFERRRGATLTLTPIGEAILPSARTILHTVDQQMVRAVEAAQSRAGTVAFGFSTGLAAGPLRAGIGDFRTANPMLSIRLVEGSPGELLRLLNERSLDIFVADGVPDLASKALAQEPLWSERLIVALGANHPFARRDLFAWDDIAQIPIILRQSEGEQTALRALLTRGARGEVNIAQHAVSCGALLDMVGLGIGATVLLESALVPHRNVVFRAIDGENALVPIQAVWRRGDGSPLRHRLLNHIRRRRGGTARSPLSLLFPATAPAPDRG